MAGLLQWVAAGGVLVVTIVRAVVYCFDRPARSRLSRPRNR